MASTGSGAAQPAEGYIAAAHWKQIRVFISSTFRDTNGERDVLTRQVFPQLRQWCAERSLQLTEVDLRWGLTAEQVGSRGEAVVQLCLDEIDRCNLFLCLIGDRYGWTPDDYGVPLDKKYRWVHKYKKRQGVTELEIQRAALNEPRDRAPDMQQCLFYMRDSSYLESLRRDAPHVVKEFVDVPLLPDGETENVVERDRIRAAHADLKARIIAEGEARDDVVVRTGYPCVFDIEKQAEHVPGKYLVSGLEKFAEDVLADLKQAILRMTAAQKDAAKPVSELEYDRTRTSLVVQQHAESLHGRSDEVRELGAASEPESAESERIVVCGEPGVGCTAVCAKFVDDIWRRVAAKDKRLSRRTLVVSHFVGAYPASADTVGVLRHIVLELRKEAVRSARARFRDQASEGADGAGGGAKRRGKRKKRRGRSAVERVPVDDAVRDALTPDQLRTLEWAQDVDDVPPPEDVPLLERLLQSLVELVCLDSSALLVIVIDGADLVIQKPSEPPLAWLPSDKIKLPNFRVIVSANEVTVSNPDDSALQHLERRGYKSLRIPRLPCETARQMMAARLARFGKTLTDEQMADVISDDEAVLPEFVSLASEELRLFSLFDRLREYVSSLPTDLKGLYGTFLGRLEEDHQKRTVSDVLALLACSPSGISEVEIQRLCCIKPARWAALHSQLKPHLQPQGGDVEETLLVLKSREMRDAIRARYFAPSGSDEQRAHLRLARFLRATACGLDVADAAAASSGDGARAGTAASVDRMNEWVARSPTTVRACTNVVDHYVRAGKLKDALDIVTDLRYVEAMVCVGRLHILISHAADVSHALDAAGVGGVDLDPTRDSSYETSTALEHDAAVDLHGDGSPLGDAARTRRRRRPRKARRSPSPPRSTSMSVSQRTSATMRSQRSAAISPRDSARSMLSFLQGMAHVLRRFPELTFQQALNLPGRGPETSRAMADWLSRREERPHLFYRNKPEAPSACILTLGELHETAAIHDVAFSECGTRVFAACEDGALRIFDATTGDLIDKLLASASLPSFEGCRLTQVAVRQGGRLTFVVIGTSSGRLALVDVESHLFKEVHYVDDEEDASPRVPAEVTRMGTVARKTIGEPSWSVPPGASSDESPRAADAAVEASAEHRRDGRTHEALPPHGDAVTALSWNVAGTYLMSGDNSGSAMVWDFSDGSTFDMAAPAMPRLSRQWEAHGTAVHVIGATSFTQHLEAQFSRSGMLAASKTREILRLTAAETTAASTKTASELPTIVPTPTAPAIDELPAVDESSEVSDGEHGEVDEIDDAVVTDPTTAVDSPAQFAMGTPTSDALEFVVTSGATAIVAWKARWNDGHLGSHIGCVASASGMLLGLWSTASGVHWLRRNSNMDLQYQAISQQTQCRLRETDGRLATHADMSVKYRIAVGFTDGSVRIYRARNGERVGILHGHLGAVNRVCYSSSGRVLVSASADGTIRMWEPSRLTAHGRASGHDTTVVDASVSRSVAPLVATVSTDGQVRCWLHSGRRPRYSFPAGGRSQDFIKAQFCSGEAQLLVVQASSGLRCWQLDATKPDAPMERALVPHLTGDFVTDCDGTVVVVSKAGPDSERFTVIEVERKMYLGAIAEPTPHRPRRVSCIRMSHDNRLLVACCDANVVEVWDLAVLHKLSKANTSMSTEQRLRAATRVGPVAELVDDSAISAAETSVSDALFSPDGKCLLLRVRASRLKLWNLDVVLSEARETVTEDRATLGGFSAIHKRERLRQISAHAPTAQFTSVQWTPCGRAIVAGTSDGKVS